MRQCPQKHKWGYVDRWTGPTSDTLTLGTGWHSSVMEPHYRAVAIGEDPSIPVAKALEDLGDRTVMVRIGSSKQEVSLAEHLRWMYDGHLEMWGHDTAWKVRAVEWSADVPLRHPSKPGAKDAKGRRSRFRIKVKIDLVVEWLGGLWVVDHKSAGQMPTEKELQLDDQFGLYVWALQDLGKPVVGAIYSTAITGRNAKKLQLPEERFRRDPLNRNAYEMDTIAYEALLTVQERYRKGAPVGRTPNTAECGWKCGFVKTCIDSRRGHADERELFIARGFNQDHARH